MATPRHNGSRQAPQAPQAPPPPPERTPLRELLRRFWQLLFWVLLAAGLTLLAFTVRIDHHRQQMVQNGLSHFLQLDAALNEELLRLRHGLRIQYDPLVAVLAALERQLGEIQQALEASDLAERPDLLGRVDGLRWSLAEKQRLVEWFKSENALLRNSQAYFPTLLMVLIRHQEAAQGSGGGGGRDAARGEALPLLRDLFREVLLHLQPGGSQRTAQMQAQIARFRQFVEGMPEEHREGFANALAHAEIISTYQGRIESRLQGAMAVATRTLAEELMTRHAAAQEQQVLRLDRFRHGLYLVALGLLAYVVLVWLRLQRNARALLRANRELQREMAARQRADEMLRKLGQALEQSPVSVVITDRVGRIEYVNPTTCRTTGYRQEELLGQNPRLFRPQEVVEHPDYAELWRTIMGGREWRGEFHNRRKDGALYWEAATISPIQDESGRITHFLAVKEEITQRKLAEEERARDQEALRQAKESAERANRAKSEFLAAMSHELRTPLNAIMGMGQLLQEDGPAHPQWEERLAVLQRNGRTLLALISDLLDLSRVEAGTLRLERTGLHLGELLEDALAGFRTTADQRGLALTGSVAPGLSPWRLGDPVRLRQILTNLVDNGLKFTAHGGVTVTIAPAPAGGDGVRFQVADSGIGVPEEKRQMIFDAFTQADGSTTRRYGGTGLGLALCRRLVTVMGGEMGVACPPEGGSVFHFDIPLPPDQRQLAAPAESRPQGGAGSVVPAADGGWRILLVEDASDNVLLVTMFLKRSGARLEVAENGQEAVERFQSTPFDLVLMDIQMPVMDGYQATRAIRAWERERGLRRTPILALTAFALEGDASRSLEAGCDAHLTKPIKKQVLLEAIARHLA